MNNTIKCPICGIDFNKKTKTQVCCTIKCKKQYTIKQKTKQCLQCKKEFIQHRKDNKFCSPKCSTDYTRKEWKVFECKQCGKEFREKGNKWNVYCSKECFNDYISIRKQNKERLKELKRKYKTYNIDCDTCKKNFSPKTKIKRCVECTRKINRENQKKRFYSKSRERICNNCGIVFNPIKKERTCSLKCKEERLMLCRKKHRTNKNHKQRMKGNGIYDSKTTLDKIKERDGEKCLICGTKVLDKNISGYHKRNATIGHIIPLSKGGNHTMRNVQLECMKCNVKKGARVEGQLRLF